MSFSDQRSAPSIAMSVEDDLLKEILQAAKLSGFGFISDKPASRATLLLSRVYLLSSIVIFALNYILISSIFFDFSEKVLPNISLFIMHTYALVLVLHYIMNKQKIISNLRCFLELKETLQDDISLFEILGKHSRTVNSLVRCLFWFNFLMTFNDALLKICCRMQLIDINEDIYLMYQVSFNATSTEMFWPTFIIQGSSLHLVIVTQMFNDLYMLNMTVLQIVLFKILRLKLGIIITTSKNITVTQNRLRLKSLCNAAMLRANCNLFKQNEYFDEIDDKIKQWISYHITLLRLCKEFNHLYYPVLLAYFANKFIGVCFGMFMITQGKADLFNVFEIFFITSYFLGNGICLLALCIAGTYLIHESGAVFNDAFHSPWYRCLPASKTNLSIIACASQKPVRLTPLCSETVEMSLDTFIWVLRAMISYYIALTQVKAAFNT